MKIIFLIALLGFGLAIAYADNTALFSVDCKSALVTTPDGKEATIIPLTTNQYVNSTYDKVIKDQIQLVKDDDEYEGWYGLQQGFNQCIINNSSD